MRSGTSRLHKISLLSRLKGGIRILVHKTGQAYEENIGGEITPATSADPKYCSITIVDLALKVKKTIPTKHLECEDTNYDEKLSAKTTERMMSTAGKIILFESHLSFSSRLILCDVSSLLLGCVVPFVDRMPNSPICEGGDSANKAMEVSINKK